LTIRTYWKKKWEFDLSCIIYLFTAWPSRTKQFVLHLVPPSVHGNGRKCQTCLLWKNETNKHLSRTNRTWCWVVYRMMYLDISILLIMYVFSFYNGLRLHLRSYRLWSIELSYSSNNIIISMIIYVKVEIFF
jgi:hypothetical protein